MNKVVDKFIEVGFMSNCEPAFLDVEGGRRGRLRVDFEFPLSRYEVEYSTGDDLNKYYINRTVQGGITTYKYYRNKQGCNVTADPRFSSNLPRNAVRNNFKIINSWSITIRRYSY